jgi:anti-sigma-K factor RskA
VTDHTFTDSVASYVLGALPPEEVAPFEAHLASCPDCRAEVERLSLVPDALGASAPPMAAPPALRERIMSTVRAEAELLQAAGPAADRPAGRRPWWRLRPALAAAGAALVAAAAVVGFVLGEGGGPARTRTIAAHVTAGAGRAASASLVREDGRLVLRVEHMAAPGRGRVYQVWLQQHSGLAPQPTPAMFTPLGPDGSNRVQLPQAAGASHQVLVTSEPAGGSRTGIPSRAPVLSATVQ